MTVGPSLRWGAVGAVALAIGLIFLVAELSTDQDSNEVQPPGDPTMVEPHEHTNLHGTVELRAATRNPDGHIDFYVSSGPAQPTILVHAYNYSRSAEWDTTSVPDGKYHVWAVYSPGLLDEDAPQEIEVTVRNRVR